MVGGKEDTPPVTPDWQQFLASSLPRAEATSWPLSRCTTMGTER